MKVWKKNLSVAMKLSELFVYFLKTKGLNLRRTVVKSLKTHIQQDVGSNPTRHTGWKISETLEKKK
jgi:hypothetical protein